MFPQMLELIYFTESKEIPSCKCNTTQNKSTLPHSLTHTESNKNEKQGPFYEVPSRKFGYKVAIGELNVLEKQPQYM